MFWLGLAVGAFIGVAFGVFITALITAHRNEANEEN